MVSAIIAAAVGYGRLLNKNEAQSEDNKNKWKVISELRAWTVAHEKDSFTVRRELEQEISAVRELALKNDGRWEEVLRRLSIIDNKIDKIETRNET